MQLKRVAISLLVLFRKTLIAIGVGQHSGGTMKHCAAIIIMITMLPSFAASQWPNYPTPGIPRTLDGKPNLSAPAPKLPDGKLDLSGIWKGDQPVPYFGNLGLKPGELVLTPEGESLQKRFTGEQPCMPWPLPVLDSYALFPFKIIQTAGEIVILHEHETLFRQIFLDGRQLPKDPNPTWLGYSVGKWDGDTLVVDTTGFNDKNAIPGAKPYSDALHITEQFRRPDFGHLQIEFTVDDPKVYMKPWSFTRHYHLVDTELMEYICFENEKDLQHMVKPPQ